MTNNITVPSDYRLTLTEIVEAVNKAKYESFKTVNKHLVTLYYDIGETITEKQQNGSWGDGIVEKLAKDQQNEFTGVRGFSARNIWNMKKFYEKYQGSPKLQTLSAEITWSSNVLIMEHQYAQVSPCISDSWRTASRIELDTLSYIIPVR